MRKTVLGLDGGGTQTRAAIVDETGHLLGFGRSGSSNYHDHGLAHAQAQVAEAVSQACRQAELAEPRFDAVYFGMGGVLSDRDAQAVQQIGLHLQLAPPDNIRVENDAATALAGGLSGRPGIVQIAGTGAVAFGRNAAGRTWRAGGWGEALADEGSGYWFGLAGMKAAVRAFDGRGPATRLRARVQAALDLDDLYTIMHRLYVVGLSRRDIAALAPLVFEAAQAGDAVAKDIIRRGVAELALAITTVAHTLDMAESRCEVALVGGLFEAGDAIIGPLTEAVRAYIPQCNLQRPELPPVLGACLLGLRLLGIDLRPALVEQLSGGLPPKNLSENLSNCHPE